MFGTDEKFEKWLDRPSGALGGIKPKELIDTGPGIKMVKQELGRIEYGVFA